MMSFELSNLITDVWEGIRPDLILPSTHGNRRGEEQHFGSHSHQRWHTLPWNHTHTHLKPSFSGLLGLKPSGPVLAL